VQATVNKHSLVASERQVFAASYCLQDEHISNTTAMMKKNSNSRLSTDAFWVKDSMDCKKNVLQSVRTFKTQQQINNTAQKSNLPGSTGEIH
jgi:hypothetical protein